MPNIKAPKNGYAYIYVSNASNQDVFFDNLKVADERGRLIEEDHYYAYGLKIAGISSKKLPDASEVANIKNNNLYNDKELFDDGDLNWYDYGYRNYDAQIGRFTQLDPLTDDYPELTNYQYAGCEPVANVDEDGLEPWNMTDHLLQDVVVKPAAQIASKSFSVFGLAVNAVKISTSTATRYTVSTEIGNTVYQGGRLITTGGGLTLGGVLLRLGGTVGGVLIPLKAGGDFPHGDEMYFMHDMSHFKMLYPFDPVPLSVQMRENQKHEIITNDPSTLSDDYLKGVQERLLLGTATPNDFKYKDEILRRWGRQAVKEVWQVVLKFIAAPKSGETKSTMRRGRQVHRDYKIADVEKNVRVKEFTLPSGKRVDFIDFRNKIIYELKPNNPRAIKAGYKQLNGYLKEVESVYGKGWTTKLDTY